MAGTNDVITQLKRHIVLQDIAISMRAGDAIIYSSAARCGLIYGTVPIMTLTAVCEVYC